MLKALSIIVLSLAVLQLQAASVDGTIHQTDLDGDGQADDSTIDHYAFDVTAGTTVVFDVLALEYNDQTNTYSDLNGDGDLTMLDAYIHIYDLGSLTSLASNDDHNLSGGVGPLDSNGSIHGWDSALEYTFASAGTYVIAIGDYHLSFAEVLADQNLDNPFAEFLPNPEGHLHGDYRIDFNVRNGDLRNIREIPEVPEPGTMALLACAAGGMAAIRRRRNRA